MPLNIIQQYKCLGLVINEHVDFNVTEEHVAKATGRALGVLIAKSKAYGDMPFTYLEICFKVLYYL